MKKNIYYWGIFSFTFYLLLLIWIILFKFQFSFEALYEPTRHINLIPFYYADTSNFQFQLSEIIQNIIIFLPMGVFLCIYDKRNRFIYKFVFIFLCSFILEFCQFVFSIGRADITDLIGNTLGGVLGIFFYKILVKLIPERIANTLIILLSGIFMIVFSVLFLLFS